MSARETWTAIELPRGKRDCGHRHRSMGAAADCCAGNRSFGGVWVVRSHHGDVLMSEELARQLGHWARGKAVSKP